MPDDEKARQIAAAERRGLERAAVVASTNKEHYRENVFATPTEEQSRKAHAALQAIGLSLDIFSAECCRATSDNIAAAIRAVAAKLEAESR